MGFGDGFGFFGFLTWLVWTGVGVFLLIFLWKKISSK